MNNDKYNLDLEGLLAEVEHAGRDARRQEELGAMIDSMAGANKHGFWWWTVRVAAAACVLFFISTAVRIWFIPTDNNKEANVVAQSDVSEIISKTVDTIPMEPSMQQPVRAQRHAIKAAAYAEPVEEYLVEEMVSEPENVAEETLEKADTMINTENIMMPEPQPIAQAEEQPANDVDVIVAPIVSVGATAKEPAVERKPKRESILKRLFHRDDISKMDGNMLAFNLL